MNLDTMATDTATIVKSVTDAIAATGVAGTFAVTRGLVRTSVTVLAASSHPAAPVCAAALAGQAPDRGDDQHISIGGLWASSLHNAAQFVANGYGNHGIATTRDLVRAALRAAGWDTWFAAYREHHQLRAVDPRTALELIRAGLDFDTALAVATQLTGVAATP